MDFTHNTYKDLLEEATKRGLLMTRPRPDHLTLNILLINDNIAKREEQEENEYERDRAQSAAQRSRMGADKRLKRARATLERAQEVYNKQEAEEATRLYQLYKTFFMKDRIADCSVVRYGLTREEQELLADDATAVKLTNVVDTVPEWIREKSKGVQELRETIRNVRIMREHLARFHKYRATQAKKQKDRVGRMYWKSRHQWFRTADFVDVRQHILSLYGLRPDANLTISEIDTEDAVFGELDDKYKVWRKAEGLSGVDMRPVPDSLFEPDTGMSNWMDDYDMDEEDIGYELCSEDGEIIKDLNDGEPSDDWDPESENDENDMEEEDQS